MVPRASVVGPKMIMVNNTYNKGQALVKNSKRPLDSRFAVFEDCDLWIMAHVAQYLKIVTYG